MTLRHDLTALAPASDRWSHWKQLQCSHLATTKNYVETAVQTPRSHLAVSRFTLLITIHGLPYTLYFMWFYSFTRLYSFIRFYLSEPFPTGWRREHVNVVPLPLSLLHLLLLPTSAPVSGCASAPRPDGRLLDDTTAWAFLDPCGESKTRRSLALVVRSLQTTKTPLSIDTKRLYESLRSAASWRQRRQTGLAKGYFGCRLQAAGCTQLEPLLPAPLLQLRHSVRAKVNLPQNMLLCLYSASVQHNLVV